MKIVIVDDDRAIRSVLRALCEVEGHVVTAELDSGAGLVNHVTTSQPDVVLLDYQLPGANGLELLVALDTEANDVDVVMITGSDDPTLQGNAADKGARGFIRKPFEPAQVIAELKRIEETRQIVSRAMGAKSAGHDGHHSRAADTAHHARAPSAVIIDDSGAVRHLLKGILEGIEVKVVGLAGGAKEGLSAVKKAHPTLIFLDVEMPGMTGIEVLPQLRVASPDSTVVIITGNASRSIVEAAVANGAKGYFLKPIRPAKVEEFVRKLLRPAGGQHREVSPVAIESFVWTDEWSVGVPGLDEHHRQMVDIINRLGDAISGKAGNVCDVVQKTLHDLSAYGRKHFTAEEAYMRHIGYAGLDAHIVEHQDFIEKMGAFTIAAACEVLDPRELYGFIARWLRGHVLGSDMLYCKSSQ